MSTIVGEAAATKPSKIRWTIFVLLLLMLAVNYVDRTSVAVAMPLISKEFGIEPAYQGILLSSFYWTYALMQVPGGMLTDRFGARRVIGFSTLAWGVFQAMAAGCTHWITLMLMRLGLGVVEAPMSPAGGKLVGIWMTRSERGRGATLLDSGAPLGVALGGAIISGLIVWFESWRAAFIVTGVGTIALGLFAYWYIRDHVADHPLINKGEVDYIEAAHKAEGASVSDSGNVRFIDFFKYRSVWGLFFGYMCMQALFAGLLTWMPVYLSAVYGFDIKQMGGAVFSMFFVGFIGELVGGWVADKWLESGASHSKVFKTIFGFASALATISIYVVAQIHNPLECVIMLSVTLFFLRWCGVYWVLPSLLGSRQRAGTVGGLMNFGGNIAGIGIPIVVGLIVQATGSYFYALMLFAGTGIGLFFCSVFIIDYRQRITSV
ncbi:MAG: MFS transporter [Rhizobiales bacterium]|nr:MFS transporter [Hyphomicrobiales bacterium]